jgi:hypothetical protein
MSESEVCKRKRNLHPLVTMDTGSLSREVSNKLNKIFYLKTLCFHRFGFSFYFRIRILYIHFKKMSSTFNYNKKKLSNNSAQVLNSLI